MKCASVAGRPVQAGEDRGAGSGSGCGGALNERYPECTYVLCQDCANVSNATCGASEVDLLDVNTLLGRLYTALIAQPALTAAGAAEATGLPVDEVAAGLASLQRSGFARAEVTATDTYWDAEPPELHIDRLLDAEEQRMIRQRRASQQLTRQYWLARRDSARYAGLEIIRGEKTFAERFALVLASANTELRSCNRPPFLTSVDSVTMEKITEEQARFVRAGVSVRSVWWHGLFDDPIISRTALKMMDDGEQSRVLAADLPLKMVIADDQRAIVYLDTDEYDDPVHLLVYPSGLLRTLSRIFETVWSISVPLSRTRGATRDEPINERERSILAMMAAGATDATIARNLDISQRTVLRVIADLCRRLGAQTRFQAGVQAARRGWL